ncbi:flagellar motor protein MotB [Metabacillus niabensis]|uniref:Chemotaxis protein MotB n=1 Tax=Metabacillus niabensis TaxID=324854 RepID=A0ABT9Z5K0_9BACI|nr:flagellar motor protein MotB [Metabacillus niabensis]MDQ0226863.1 chemotaxis protein MotB [Metabacillus niabensis]
MAKKKKKQHHDEHMDESWLVPYADILTLLLALFIVLFAASNVDAKKFHEIAKAFNTSFSGGTGVLEFPSPTETGEMEQLDVQEKKSTEATEEELKQLEQEKLAEIKEKVDSYIDEKKLGNQLQTTLTEDGLLITILDEIFFDSGIAEIREKDKHLAKEISELLVMNPPRNITVSGHTDNVPINNSAFDSNLDLSAKRAVNFISILIENKKLDPSVFSAEGFGEFRPVASNDTAEGREKNRRVEVLILPNEKK